MLVASAENDHNLTIFFKPSYFFLNLVYFLMAAAPAKPGHIKPNLETALTFGKKKTSLAVATVTMGKGMIRVNGVPLHLVEPEVLRAKIMEPVLLIG